MKKQLEIVQLLRAFGCVIIALFHLPSANILKPSQSGFVLAVFFTISGFFLIKGITKTTENYFLKKIIRIVPLYWFLTLIIFFAEMIKPGLISDNDVTPEMLVKSMFFIPYYSSDNNIFPVLSVGWTLILEFFVYIIFYLCFVLSRRLFSNEKKYQFVSVLMFGIIIFFGTILKSVLKLHNPILEVWGSKYQWSFFFGMIIYFITHEGKYAKKVEYTHVGISYVSVAALLAVFITFSYFVFYLPVLAAGIVVYICISKLKDIHIPKPFVILGNVSFSFYLIHKFIVGIVCRLLPYTKLNGFFSDLLSACLVILISFGVSFVLYYFIEKKLSSLLIKKILSPHHPTREKNPNNKPTK